MFRGPINNTYIAVCVGGGYDCPRLSTLAAAQAACAADRRCGGVTQQYHGYSLRAGNTAIPSPANKPSTSWLVTNRQACSGPSPPPAPIQPDPEAAAHARAAFAGLTRTDPEATWVYQTWIWRGYGEDRLRYLKGWIDAVPRGRLLLLDQTVRWARVSSGDCLRWRSVCLALN